MLTSHALYRVAFSTTKGAIDHYSRTSLGSCQLIERGRYAFKLRLTEPDGRENPFSYFWYAAQAQERKSTRCTRATCAVMQATGRRETVMQATGRRLTVARKVGVCEERRQRQPV